MAVVKLKSGKWQAIVSYRRPDNLDVFAKKRSTFNTKREAVDFETDFLRSLSETIHNELLTYQDVIDQYVEWNRLNASERSVKDNIYILDRFTKTIKKKKYNKLKRSDFTAIYLTISKQDWSVSRKNRAVKQIKTVSKFAYNHLDLPDRTKHLELFKKNSDDIKDIQVWTPEELDAFLENVDGYMFKALFWFQYYTGARIGETRALLKEDLSGNLLSINKSIKSQAEGFKPLKNTSSRRTITLDDNTMKILEPLLNFDGPFIFGDEEPLSENTVQRRFKAALKLSDVSIIRVHDLRHSHASLLINKGANIVAVSKRLGHSDIQTTLRTYTHLLQESDDEMLSILNSL